MLVQHGVALLLLHSGGGYVTQRNSVLGKVDIGHYMLPFGSRAATSVEQDGFITGMASSKQLQKHCSSKAAAAA